MKKIITVILALCFVFSLAACGESEEKNCDYRIAIVQQMDHSSLDEIAAAVKAQLLSRAEAADITIDICEYSGQNDATVLGQIGIDIMSKNVDLIIPIATLAAECMVNSAEGKVPVVCAAVSAPDDAGLSGLENVTGVSDALNTQFILDMMLAINPDIECVGLLYSLSEPNSATPIAQAKDYLESKGISYIEKTGNTTDEIVSAADSLVGRVDAVFTPTDNVVMGAESAVAEIFTEAGIAHYTGADSFVTGGAFATCGVNYTELGTLTADMAMDILLGGEIGAFRVMDGGIITVNTDTAAALNINFDIFESMAGSLVKVKTGE